MGAIPKLYFLTCPKDILIQRLRERNAERRPDSVVVPESKFRTSWNWFQPPGADEEFELVDTGT